MDIEKWSCSIKIELLDFPPMLFLIHDVLQFHRIRILNRVEGRFSFFNRFFFPFTPFR